MKARHFELWLAAHKSQYSLGNTQILADEDGMYAHELSEAELRNYTIAHADYLTLTINKAKNGITYALNELWDLVKRGGLSSEEYDDIKQYYNGTKQVGFSDVDSSKMGDL